MSRDNLEQRLAEAERKIEKQAQEFEAVQRKIDAAIQTAQQTILTDRAVRQGGNLSRGKWAYSRASAESSLNVIQQLESDGRVYSPTKRRSRRHVRRKRNRGFFGFLRGFAGLVR